MNTAPIRLWLAERHPPPGMGFRRDRAGAWVLLHQPPTTLDHADSRRIFAVSDTNGSETIAEVLRRLYDRVAGDDRLQLLPKPKQLPYQRG